MKYKLCAYKKCRKKATHQFICNKAFFKKYNGFCACKDHLVKLSKSHSFVHTVWTNEVKVKKVG